MAINDYTDENPDEVDGEREPSHPPLEKVHIDDLADEQLPHGRLPSGELGIGFSIEKLIVDGPLKITIENLSLEAKVFLPCAIILVILTTLGFLHH